MWKSGFLVASNAAAILPAYRALRQKAFPETILFTSSGISSAVYHACDTGTWCAASFHSLQFMDFWLSFWTVVSTFVYLASLEEVSKRTIHTAVAISTALLAETGPTRPRNIILVIAIGAGGLILGWLIDNYRSLSFPTEFYLDMLQRCHTFEEKEWLHSLMKKVVKYMCRGFLAAGFATVTFAGICMILETRDTYWIWHSIWHISGYTAAFLFLSSKSNTLNSEEERPPAENYELTRQDSCLRGDGENPQSSLSVYN